MRSALPAGQATFWIADPITLRRHCEAAVRALIAMPASTASLRLLADQTANVLVGFAAVLEATALLVAGPARPRSRPRGFKIYVLDWLPSLVSAGRAFVAIGAAELFWVLTAWPDGGSAIVFVAVAVLLLSPRAELAYADAIAFMLGAMTVIPIAAAIKFALLPALESFPAFCIALAAFLIPVGTALAATRQYPCGHRHGYLYVRAPAYERDELRHSAILQLLTGNLRGRCGGASVISARATAISVLPNQAAP